MKPLGHGSHIRGAGRLHGVPAGGPIAGWVARRAGHDCNTHVASADVRRGRILNSTHVIAVVGFIVGGAIAVYWESKSDASAPPEVEGAEWRPRPRGDADESPAAGIVTDQHAAPPSPERQQPPPPPPNTQVVNEAPPEAGTKQSSVAGPTQTQARPEPATKQPPAQAAQRTRTLPRFGVRLDRILVGEQLVTNGILVESKLEEHGERNQYIIYFELVLEHRGDTGQLRLTSEDFRLEDGAGLSYPAIEAGPTCAVALEPTRSGRLGVAFAVYNDSAPARLHYRSAEHTFTPLPVDIFTPRRK